MGDYISIMSKMFDLLTTNNKKIMKGRDRGYIVFGLHLLPGKVCARATPGCLRSCLNTVGNGRYPNVQKSRSRKTQFFWKDLPEFLRTLEFDIEMAIIHARKMRLTPAFRLNLTSDIPWEAFGIPQKFSDQIFFDYTKYNDRHAPDNYHLTFSRAETELNQKQAREWLDRGGNVAVVFRGEMPKEYWGKPVVSGDEDDLRFLDPKGCIVGLKAKGRAQTDKSGFVVRLPMAA